MEDKKVKALLDAPTPKDVTSLRSFLGMVSYYFKFLDKAAIKLKPLYKLLENNVEWNWTKECEESLVDIKKAIARKPVLMSFDPTMPLKLTCDASPYGVAAILSHILEQNKSRPIAFASKTLSKSQQNYSQIHKEA